MSATGQGGVSLISGQSHGELDPVVIGAGEALTFTHRVGRKAYQVLVSDGTDGYLLLNTVATVTQPDVNTIIVTNNAGEGSIEVYISCRWENLTTELDLIGPDDGRVVIENVPD